MSTYNITITPLDEPGIQTSVSVEVEGSGRAVRVTEMTVRAAEGSGLPGARLPAVDVELLLQAIAPPVLADASTNGHHSPAPRRSPASATVPAPRSDRRLRRGRTPAATEHDSTMRAYRRMPDDLSETYERLHSITALAEHYEVPRHTAQGWMNRLRRQALEQ